MRYDNPELCDRLAADYALGLLRGPARRRLETLARRAPMLAEAVERWELRLNLLADLVTPVVPPERVWRAIEHGIGPADVPAATIVPFERRATVSRRVMEAWRAGALAALAAAASLAIYVGVSGFRPDRGAVPVGLLSDDAGRPAYVVTVDPDRRRLAIAAVVLAPPPAGKAYQLWLLPHGAKPISLGVLPTPRRGAFAIQAGDWRQFASADGMAISIEPAGGSPTGQPTGAIVFKGAVISNQIPS